MDRPLSQGPGGKYFASNGPLAFPFLVAIKRPPASPPEFTTSDICLSSHATTPASSFTESFSRNADKSQAPPISSSTSTYLYEGTPSHSSPTTDRQA